MPNRTDIDAIVEGLSEWLAAGRCHALSIRQPWVHHILHDGKDVENRDWPTRYRGWVLLHASKNASEDRDLIRRHNMPLGGICGAARIVDCVKDMDSDWFFGEYGFVLADAAPLPFVACKGALGFFRPDPEIIASVRSALLEARER